MNYSLTTVSMAVVTFACWMPRQSYLWHYNGLDCTKCIFEKRLKEVLITKPLKTGKPNCELQWIDVSGNVSRPLTLWHFRYLKGKISMDVTLWKSRSLDSVDSALYYYKTKNNLEPELKENAFWGVETKLFSKIKM